MKLLRKRCPQLACLPGCFYKNVFFFMQEKYTSPEDWNSQVMGERYVDISLIIASAIT